MTSTLTLDRAATLLTAPAYAAAGDQFDTQLTALSSGNAGDYAAAKEFVGDEAAQTAIAGLVVDLIAVAEEYGQAPKNWADISCDGSLESTLKDLGGIYIDAADGEAPLLRQLIEEYADDLTRSFTSDKIIELGDAVRNAKNLDALQRALEAADEYAKRSGTDIESIYDATNLPVFGGAEPENTKGIFSYDEGRVLWGHGEWSISDRTVDPAATIHQQSGGFEIGDVAYRYEDRFLLGSDQIDTVRFSRWKKQDEQSSVFNGYINVPAFNRDIVLLSDMIEAVEAVEASWEEGFED